MGDRNGEGSDLGNIGNVYTKLGDYPKALDYYQQALKIKREIKDRNGEGDTLTGIGAVYADLGDYPKALSYHQQALKIKREIKDRNGEGDTLTGIGAVYANLGDYPKALDYYQQALKIKRAIGDRSGEGTILGNIGNVYDSLGDYPSALSHYQQSLKIAREIGNRNGEGVTLTGIGNVYILLGDYPKALAYDQQALKIKRAIKDRNGEGNDLTGIGNIYYSLGDYPKALAHYQPALKIKRALGDRNGEGNDLTGIGNVYYSLGDYPKALASYQQALKIKREIGDRNGEGSVLGNIGVVYQSLGDYSKALASYQQALKVQQKIGVPTGIVEGNIGLAYLEQGRLRDAYAIFRKLKDPVRLGLYHLKKGEHGEAKKAFKYTLQRAGKTRESEPLLAGHIGLGLALEGLKDDKGAGKHYRKAVELMEEQRASLNQAERRHFFSGRVYSLPRITPYEGLTRVSTRLNRAGDALYYSEGAKARLLLEALARRSPSDRFRLPAGLSREETDLANRLAATRKQRDAAFKKGNRERFKALEGDQAALKQKQEALVARLRRDFPEYASLRYPAPFRAGAMVLRPGEALIEYEVTDRESLAWVLKREGGKTRIVNTVRIPVTREALQALVRKYRGYFEEVNTLSDLAKFDPKVGKRLYDLLLRDAVAGLGKGVSLIIVPDEVLGILPFEALVSETPKKTRMPMGRHGPIPLDIKYAGDQWKISYMQSATALSILRNLGKGASTPGKTILTVADPVFDIADARLPKGVMVASRSGYAITRMRAIEEVGGFSFPRLEATGRLADDIAKVFGPGARTLKGLNASEARLKAERLGDYRYLLFATHGILDDTVPHIQEPALVLNLEGNRKEDGFLTMTEVMGLSLNANIAALTACETGLGRDVSGEGVMGMGRAFQYAGARGVLMSLWSVEEDSTSIMTERFFTYLKKGKGRMEALRLARADIRRMGYEHPFFWAPFILVGSGK